MSRLSRGDERVARALDKAETPADRGVAGLVAIADRLREAGRDPGLCAAPDYRAESRRRLLAEASALLPRPRPPAEAGGPHPAHLVTGRRRGPRHAVASDRRGPASRRRADPQRARRRVLAMTAVAAVALSGTVVVASGGALPGDPLYGLKRRVQGVELAFAHGEEDRGRRHLGLARQRAEEIRTVAAGSGSTWPLVAALDDMDAQTRIGVRLLATAAIRRTDDAVLGDLTGWVDGQRDLLLAASVPLRGPTLQRANGSLDLLRTASARVAALREALPCHCPNGSVDELGPLPCTGCVPGGTVPTAASKAPDPQGSRQPPAGSTAPTGSTAAPPSAPGRGTSPAPTSSGPQASPTGGLPPVPTSTPGPLLPSAPAPRLPLPTAPIVPSILVPPVLVGLLGGFLVGG